jgi:DHA1 family bicyclomycin/chloramphenicol resistance-like MFS transporter
MALLGPFAIHLFFPLIPVIKLDFQLSDALAQLAFSLGVFGMAFSTLAYGALADRHGRRPVLLAGLFLFLCGSVLAALANSFAVLLAGRLIQAVGAGCGITLGRAIARDVYGPSRLVKAIAYLTMFFAIGGLLAPGVGGYLVDQLGWRAVFSLAALIGLAIALAAYFIVPETAAQNKGRKGTSIFASWIELCKHARFSALVVHTGCSTGTFLVVATASSMLMKEVLHRPATEFGLYFAMVPAGFVTGTFISSRIGNRASINSMVMIGACLAVAAVLIQSTLLLSGYLTPVVLFLPASLMTMAQGISLPYAQTGAMAMVPRLAATASGIGVFVQNFLGAAFAQLYGWMADGSAAPLIETTAVTVGLGLASAMVARFAPDPIAYHPGSAQDVTRDSPR